MSNSYKVPPEDFEKKMKEKFGKRATRQVCEDLKWYLIGYHQACIDSKGAISKLQQKMEEIL